jgi:nucleotidyltransferase/DNA polymerase involved in DNA repair
VPQCEAAESIRDRIFRVAHVPVTVGFARTKTIAKLVSDTAKPFGALALLDRDAERELLQRHPVTEISGIGGKRALRLLPYGIHTCLDLANADRRLIRDVLTQTGEVLWYELNGDPVSPIQTNRPHHKVLARGGSLGGATADPDRVYGWLVRNLERLVEELEFHTVAAGVLSVSIQHMDGLEGGAQVKLLSPTNRFDLLLDAAQQCFRKAWFPGVPATYMHVVATDLRWPGSVQLGLFDPPLDRTAAPAEVKHQVNKQVGRFALQATALGSYRPQARILQHARAVTGEPTGWAGAK